MARRWSMGWWWSWLLLFGATQGQDAHPVPTPIHDNQVLQLNGTPGFVGLPPDIFNDLTSATVEGWVRFDRLARGRLFDFGRKEQAMTVGTVEFQPDLTFEIWDADHRLQSVTVAGVIATNRWCHIAAVSGPGGMKLFLNGHLVGSNTYTGSFASVGDGSRNRLGRSNWSDGDLMDNPDATAQLDDFAVWDHERSPDQIRASLKGQIQGDESGLVGLWRFDQGDARDSSPRAIHGRLEGNASCLPAPHPTLAGPLHRAFVHGTVTGESDMPLAGASVTLFHWNKAFRSTRTDASGAYLLHVLPHEVPFDIRADSGVLGRWQSAVQFEGAGGLRQDLQLTPVNRVSGRVTALDGSPIGGVVIQALRLGPTQTASAVPQATTATDPQGRYQFAHLRPGEYAVKAHTPGRLIDPIPSGSILLDGSTVVTNVGFHISPFRKGTWRTFNTHDGLPSVGIRTLFRDPAGMLWIGTRNGLSRFDGSVIRSFTTEDGLAGNDVASISRDSNGVLWVVAEDGGLSRSSGDGFVPVQLSSQPLASALQAVHADRQGRIWVGGPGLFSISGNRITHYTDTNGFPAEQVYKITSGPDGRLWLGTDEGLVSFDGSRFVNVTREAGLNPFVVDSPRVAPDGSVWFGSWGNGIWRHDPSRTNGASLRNWTTADGLVNDYAWMVEFGPDATVWVATMGGVSRFDGVAFVNHARADGLADNHVSTILRDPLGLLWFATQAGLTRYDPHTTLTYTTADGLPANAIRSSTRGPDGMLWFATERGLARWDGNAFRNFTTLDGLPSNDIRDVAARQDGSVCVVTASAIGIHDGQRFTPLPTPESVARNVSRVSIAPDGTIAAGTFAGELVRWHDPRESPGVRRVGDGAFQKVLSILCLSSNQVWIGLDGGGGVVRIHPSTAGTGETREILTVMKSRDGLADDYGIALAADRQGGIWVGGATGLSRIGPEGVSVFNQRGQAGGEAIRHLHVDSHALLWIGRKSGVRFSDGSAWSQLDDRDGLPDNEVHTVVEDPDGSIWLGTDRGLARHRRWIETPPGPRLMLRGKPSGGSGATAPILTTDHPATFSWQLTEFRTPPENRLYRWNIRNDASPHASGSDVVWSDIRNGSALEWSTNRPGTYRLSMQFIDRNLNLSDVQTLTLEVQSPWFQRALVMVPLIGLNAGLIGWGVYSGLLFLRKRRETVRLRQQLLEEERKAREAAESSNKAKSLFLASMSHELRTPLNAIIGYSELVQEELVEANQAGLVPDLQRINAAARHQLALVNDILDFSKIEAGKMTLFFEEFEIAPLVQDVGATMLPIVHKNQNHLELDCPADIGTIRTDQTRLRQILLNLLSNAAKFTDKGLIRVQVLREPNPDPSPTPAAPSATPPGDRLVVRISDTGIGMTPEQLSRLFKVFSQAEADTARNFGGTGLGLALSRGFAQMMGGDLTVESRAGSGSTFTVVIPDQPDTPATN